MHLLKQSTAASVLVGPVMDSAGASYTGMTIADFNLTKNGVSAAMAAAATATHDHNGMYVIALTTGNTDTLGRAVISCNKATYAMPASRFEVLTAATFDALVTNAAGSSNGLFRFGDVLATVTNLTNLPPITADWLTAAGVKADAVAKIQSGLSTYAGGPVASVSGAVGSIAGVSFPANFSLFSIDSSGRVDIGKVLGTVVVSSDGTLASATATTVTFPATDSSGNLIPDDTRYQFGILGIQAPTTGAGQNVFLTTRTGVRTFGVLSGTMPVPCDGTSRYQLNGYWKSSPDLTLNLGTPRDMSAVADASMTLNDALWAAIQAGVGRRDMVGTTVTYATPGSHTTLRIGSVDIPTAPTYFH